MSYETIPIEKICRTCLSPTNINMRSLFSIDEASGETLRLIEMLTCCASVQVMIGDGLPSSVCLQCAHYINRSYSFKQLCERSENTLRELLGRSIQVIPQHNNRYVNPEQPFLELKPLLNTDSLVSNSVTEIISGVAAVLDPPLPPVSESLSKVGLEIIPLQPPEQILESTDNQNIHEHTVKDTLNDMKETINEVFTEQHSLNCKFESFDHEPVFSNETDSDTGQDSKYVQKIQIENVNCVQTQLDDNVQQDLDELNVHLEAEQINNVKTECDKTEKKVYRDETNQRIYPCEKCTFCFTTSKDLKAHSKVHKGINRHRCKVCSQDFASASTLCRHMKTHEGSKRHPCTECGKKFYRSDDLTRHLRTHTGEKPFQCELCGKSFAQSFRLLEHMRAHANEKTFVCTVCGKAFSRYTSLAAHNKTHLGLKTHTCTLCGKKLCGSGSLAMHMKTHTGLKDHICPYCGKGFTTPSNLIIHKRTHTGERPYICKTCGKGFPDPSRLTVHSRSHSGEKPYVCNICGRGCVSSSQLKKHMRIHTGERPYQCSMCPRAFPRSEDLKVHTKTHTAVILCNTKDNRKGLKNRLHLSAARRKQKNILKYNANREAYQQAKKTQMSNSQSSPTIGNTNENESNIVKLLDENCFHESSNNPYV